MLCRGWLSNAEIRRRSGKRCCNFFFLTPQNSVVGGRWRFRVMVEVWGAGVGLLQHLLELSSWKFIRTQLSDIIAAFNVIIARRVIDSRTKALLWHTIGFESGDAVYLVAQSQCSRR